MEDLEDKEESFLAKMVQGGRITIPYEIREKLSLKVKDRVKVRVSKDEPQPASEEQDPPPGG